VVSIAPVGQADTKTYICGIGGFVISDVDECPRCWMRITEEADRPARSGDILDQVATLLSGDDAGD
jgi:hypothetical protein